MLYGNGTIEYLVLMPESETGGFYAWTDSLSYGKYSAYFFFPNCEGIDVHGSQLYFISKMYKSLYILDLDSNTYTNSSTVSGLFSGQPDQVVQIIRDDSTISNSQQGNVESDMSNDVDMIDMKDDITYPDDILYFTEDGGQYAGVHGRDMNGQYYTILESYVYSDETTGLAFSPDGKYMYIAYQDDGILFEIKRKDGLPFYGKALQVKYHKTSS